MVVLNFKLIISSEEYVLGHWLSRNFWHRMMEKEFSSNVAVLNLSLLVINLRKLSRIAVLGIIVGSVILWEELQSHWSNNIKVDLVT